MKQKTIRFRVWHNELKKMLYPPMGFDSMNHARDSNGKWVTYHIDGKEVPYPSTMHWDGRQYIHGKFQDVVWMQFTNLKDKNGKDRCEGDVIKRNTGYIFVEEVKTFVLGPLGQAVAYGYSYMPDDEIIGNIYENPELLNQ